MIIGTELSYHNINEAGLIFIAFGVGLLLGVKLALLWLAECRDSG